MMKNLATFTGFNHISVVAYFLGLSVEYGRPYS